MNEGRLGRLLTEANPWWRQPARWRAQDRELVKAREAPFEYEPAVLDSIEPNGLYILYGPRRVGKSVVLKQRIERLLDDGVAARRIVYFTCDGLAADDLRRLENVVRGVLTRGVDEPRFWLLDEVTAVPGWPAMIKWLRDQTAFGDDCVVLTGSSARDLAEARKQLAGRRGRATQGEISLLPMSFRSFCNAAGFDLPAGVPVIPPGELLRREAREAIELLLPWLDELLTAWELFLRVGGFPRAVADQLGEGAVSEEFQKSLWDVIHGDALRRARLGPLQTAALLQRIVLNLSSRTNLSDLAREIDVASHHTVKERIDDLVAAMIVWPCHREGPRSLPALRAQSKLYFSDPLYARVARWAAPTSAEPEASQLAEQQLGLAILRALPVQLGSPDSYCSPMYGVTRNSEIDFVGPELRSFGIEGKYVDVNLGRERLTLRRRFGKGILATRSAIDLDDEVLGVPAPFVALLLNR